jgi:hypothetical protein
MIYFVTMLKLFWKPIAFIGALIYARWAGGRNAKLKADVAAAKANLRRIKTREEIEDEIQGDPDLVARARNIGLVRPE